MSEAIKQIIAERGIERLVHFTRLDNLASILAHGLIPRVVVHGTAPDAVVNDALRLDNRKWWNCLSITFPNSRMFYAYQMKDQDAQWCILLISPRLLFEKQVLFCRHNAADARISGKQDHALSGHEAFAGMFEEIEGMASRQDQSLKDADPTDLQAEVLVRGIIEPSYFDGVVFRSQQALDDHKQQLGELVPYLSDQRGFFAHRGFYRKWGKGQ